MLGRLHTEELRNLYALPNIMRVVMRWMGHIARVAVMRNVYITLGEITGKTKA
jgi:hypothetical protein